MSFITVAVQCHNYQRRLCWMLSSLMEQTRRGRFEVNVAYVPENGHPTTEAVLDFFSPSLRIVRSCWPDETQFKKRGLVRNRQLLECQTEWLLFADCDMVYHPRYFLHLARLLVADHVAAPYMLSSGRKRTELLPAVALVDSTIIDTPIQVKDCFARAGEIPGTPFRANVGAGFSQLINVRHAPHSGWYVNPDENWDWDWDRRCANTRSDVQFRKRMNSLAGPRQRLPRWFGDHLIHLNHERDGTSRTHLTLQR